MDKVRVMVSSTCYDLNQIRRNLEYFIDDMGYEPVLSDSKNIAIPPNLGKIETCKYLVNASDILVLIIGGRYGSTDADTGKSITNVEFDTAIEKKMPVYVFIDLDVYRQRSTYKNLKPMQEKGGLSEEKIREALGPKIEDLRIFDFIENVEKSRTEQWIFSFTEANEITNQLRQNWSLHFHNLLSGEPVEAKRHNQQNLPRLDLYWLDDNNEETEILRVPSVDKAQIARAVGSLPSLKVTDEQLLLMKERGEIIDEYNSLTESFDREGKSKIQSTKDVIQKAMEFNEHIEQMLRKHENEKEMFVRWYEISRRAVLARIRIRNSGTAVAENITAYIIPKKKTWYSQDLSLDNEIRPPESRPKIIDHYIELAQDHNIESEIEKMKKRKKQLEDSFEYVSKLNSIALGRIANVDMLRVSRPTFTQTDVSSFDHLTRTRVEEIYDASLDGERIRLDVRKKLSHGFMRDFSNILSEKQIYICSSLEKGEREKVDFICHSDSLPQPDKGELWIEGI